MDYESIIVEKQDKIGFIILNKPETLNVFTTNLAKELNSALIEFDLDDDIRVVVVKANGKGFSAGIDMNELKDKTFEEYYNTTTLMEEMNLTITKMKKPVIASVHGFAVANGIGLVALCDLAIASKETKFGATAINVGLSCIGPSLALSKSLGRKKTLELLLTGKIIKAQEALEIGLINMITDEENLEKETLKLANELAQKSPLALQITKRAFYKMADLEFEKALEIANYAFSEICMLKDAKEGIDAFMEKRKPNWKME